VSEQVDRAAAWGASRQEAWSGYYRYVHRFLRDVVRLDPDRALSQRLREQVRAWRSRPFALVAASDGRIRLLRVVSARGARPPVGEPRGERECELAIVAAEPEGPDLGRLVEEAMRDGARDLAGVTRRVVGRLDRAEHYRAIGRVAGMVGRLRGVRQARERPWVPVTRSVEIEDWSIERAEEESSE
jgi:chromosome partition protein MukF